MALQDSLATTDNSLAVPRLAPAHSASDPWTLASQVPASSQFVAEWIRSYQDTGCMESRNRVLMGHLRLISRHARAYSNANVSYDDLMVEGAIALLRALDNFDPNRGVSFIVYAGVFIEHCIRSQAIRATTTARKALATQVGMPVLRRPSASGKSVAQTNASAPTPTPVPPSTSSSLGSTNGFKEPLLSVEQVGDAKTESPLLQIELADETEALRAAVETLPTLERRVVAMRFGIANGREHSLGDIRSQLDLTTLQVHQALNRGLRMLRGVLTHKQTKPA